MDVKTVIEHISVPYFSSQIVASPVYCLCTLFTRNWAFE